MATQVLEWVGKDNDFLVDYPPPPAKPKIIHALDISDEIPSKKPLRVCFWKEDQILKARIVVTRDEKWVSSCRFVFEHGRVVSLDGDCPFYHIAVDEVCGFDTTQQFADLLLRLAPKG